MQKKKRQFDVFLIPVHAALRNISNQPFDSCETLTVCNAVENSGFKGLKQALLLHLMHLLLGDRQNADYSISFSPP